MTDIELCRTDTCRTTPAPGYADRGLCDMCERRGMTALTELPRLWFDLGPLVREKPATGIGTTGGTFGPSVPLNLHADALVRDIGHVTALWAEIVRDRRGMSPHIGTVRDRCLTLRTHWSVLISVRDWPVANQHDHTFGAVDAYTLDGVDGIIDLTRLHARAVATVGQTAQMIDLPGICNVCQHPSLRHRDGDDTMTCGWCHTVKPWVEYAIHVDILTAAGRV